MTWNINPSLESWKPVGSSNTNVVYQQADQNYQSILQQILLFLQSEIITTFSSSELQKFTQTS